MTVDKKTPVFLLITLAACAGILEGGSYLVLRHFHKEGPQLTGEALDRTCHLFDRSSAYLPSGVKPHYTQRFMADEFTTTVRTNNVGFREEKDYAGERVDIGFLGDSFTFGHGVELGERYSDLLRTYYPGKVIYSYSYANGYAPPHYYLFLRNNPQYVAKVMVLGLTLTNDLVEDIEDAVFHFDSDGELASVGSRSIEISDRGTEVTRFYARNRRFLDLLDRSSFGRLALIAIGRLRGRFVSEPAPAARPTTLSRFHRAELDATNLIGLEYVRKLARHLESRGSRLVVFVIPEAFSVGSYHDCPYAPDACRELREKHYPQKAIAAWLRENGIDAVDPTDRFQAVERSGKRLYFVRDAHWTREGHRVAAELLHEFLSGTGAGQEPRSFSQTRISSLPLPHSKRALIR